jgi:peptidoglycan/LPS O-acetylase OafA/YrhL
MGRGNDQGSGRAGFLPRIESMRGIAALTVAFLHATTPLFGFPPLGGLDRAGLFLIKALTNGYGAVVAFFVISGFVLARSLDRRFDAKAFAIARAFRLIPAAAVAVGVFALLYAVWGYQLNGHASYSFVNVVLNMLMLRADIDGIMWSMKAEVIATPLIFLCAWIGRSGRPRLLLAMAGALFGLSFVGEYAHGLGDDTNLAPLFAFPVGVWLHFEGHKLVDGLSSRAAALLAAAAVLVFCGCSCFNTVASIGLLAECLSAATLIACREADAIFSPLDHPVVRFYGKISYSFYLLHPLSLWSAARIIEYLMRWDSLPLSVIGVATALATIAATTPFAYLSWRLVETPFVRLGRIAFRGQTSGARAIAT